MSILSKEVKANQSHILFDDEYTLSLLGSCLRDGFINLRAASNDSQRSWQEIFLEQCRKSRYKRRSLEALLLYDQVFLDWGKVKSEIDDVAPLKAIGCEPDPISLSGSGPWLKYVAWDEPAFNKFVADIFNISISLERGDEELELLYVEDDEFWKLFDDEFQRDIELFKHVVRQRCSRKTRQRTLQAEIPRSRFPIALNIINDPSYRAAGFARMRSEARNWEELWMRVKADCFTILEETFIIRRLLDASVMARAPVMSQRLKVPIPKARPQLSFSSPSPESYLQAYQICLEDVHYLPRVENIYDVLRLRDDSRVRDFREVLAHWAQMLQEGDFVGERRIRQDIAKASEEFKKLQSWANVGRWLAYVAIPLAVASIWLVGPLGAGVGIAEAALGAAIQIHHDRKERELRWLAFGQ